MKEENEQLEKSYKIEKLKNVLDEQSLKEALEEMEKDYIPISVMQNILEQNKAKTDCRYCNNACDSYAVCTVLNEILEKGNK